MSTEIMTAPAINIEVTPGQQAAWLNLAKGKNLTLHNLASLELQAQGILLPVLNSQDYKEVDVATAAYRKAHTDMVEYRKTYTNAIDTGIVQPLMAIEKRVDPKVNTQYITLSNLSLSLRKAEADKAAVANQKNAEISRFKAHVENEFFRVAAEYRNLLRKECTGQYEIALRARLNPFTGDIKLMLQTLAVPAFTKFNTTLLTGEEMATIYGTVPKPDYSGMYSEACKELDAMFANFDSDVANAEAAIAFNNQQAELAAISEAKTLSENQAITTLIASAETVVIDTPVIRTSVQVIVIESEAWARAVMAAFIVNMPHLADYIRVKKWSNLSIGQMAEALGKHASKTGVKFSNLNLQEVEK